MSLSQSQICRNWVNKALGALRQDLLFLKSWLWLMLQVNIS